MSQGHGSSVDLVTTSLNQEWSSETQRKIPQPKTITEQKTLCRHSRQHHRRRQKENLLSHAVAKRNSWHLTPETRVRWAPLALFKKHHFVLSCLFALRSHTHSYSSPQHTGARLFAEVIDEKFILFWGCLNIQSGSVTGCWAAGLAVALQLRASQVQAANSKPYSWSNKILRNLIQTFFFPLFLIRIFWFINLSTLQHFTVYSPELDQGCCVESNENLGVQRETSPCACMCVYKYIYYFEKRIDRHPMKSCLQAEFPTRFFSTRLNQDIYAIEAKDFNI